MSRLSEEIRIAGLALQFLTRLPVPDPGWSADRMAATPRWYPAVGAMIGGAAGVVFWGAGLFWPPVIAAILATVAGVLITGGMHEDGLADTADGLGGGSTRERALEIMRDSRIGAYGALALILILLAKIGALAAMPAVALWVLIAAHSMSRFSTVWAMVRLEYARTDGAARPVAGGIGPGGIAFAAATTIGALVPLWIVLGASGVLAAVVGCMIGHVVMRWWFQRRLGGYTGDTLGAVQQASEIGVYLGVLAWL